MAQMRLEYSVNGCRFCAGPDDGGAISISASVGQGGRNLPADVSTIQRALNGVSPGDGGPTLQLKVDGMIGPKTLAAINKYQKRKLGWCDGRIDPNGPTLAALNAGGGVAPPTAGVTPAPLPTPADAKENAEFIEVVGLLLPTARRWVTRANFALDMAIDANTDRRDPLFPERGLKEFGLVSKYFQITPLSRPQRIAYMRGLKRVFLDMQVVISQSVIGNNMLGYGCGFFQPDPDDATNKSQGYDAFTFYGGWNARSGSKPRMSKQDNYVGRNLREDSIFFPVSHYRNRSVEYVVTVIIHELAHFVGPGVNSADRIGDHSHRAKADFLTQGHYKAKRTADAYAQFAGEVFLGRPPTIMH